MPSKGSEPTFFVVAIFSFVAIPLRYPNSLAMTKPVLEIPLEEGTALPLVLTEAFRSSVDVIAYVAVTVLKPLFTVAVFDPASDLTFVLAEFVLDGSGAVGFISPPFPGVQLSGCAPLAVAVFHSGDKLPFVLFSVVGIINPLALGFAVDVVSDVYPLFSRLAPVAVLHIVLEVAFVECLRPADHKPKPMNHAVDSVPNKHRFVFEQLHPVLHDKLLHFGFGPPFDQLVPVLRLLVKKLLRNPQFLLMLLGLIER